MAYYGVNLHDSITLGRIFSIHYFEYMSDFSFEGESHNFWEFVCVDKGEVDVTRGKNHTILKRVILFFTSQMNFIMSMRLDTSHLIWSSFLLSVMTMPCIFLTTEYCTLMRQNGIFSQIL